MIKNKLLLLTNDDGVYAPGITTVRNYLENHDQEYFVVAPLTEKSAVGHSITLHSPLRVKEITKKVIAVEGTPTDCVYFALHGFLEKKPNVIISGVNKGGNLGNDLTYSGTFSAALEGFYNGITSIAVSLYIDDFSDFNDDFFITAAEMLFVKIIPFIENSVGADYLYKIPHLINVNIPLSAVKNSRKANIKWTKLGKRNYGGEIIKRKDPRGRDYFWIGGDQISFQNIENSDCNEVYKGNISVTPIKIDLTDFEILDKFKNKKE